MERVLNLEIGKNFIDSLADFIINSFPRKNRDFSDILCVFGGKRPSLFLKRTLAKKLKGAFFAPTTFSMDEFVEYIVSKEKNINIISNLDSCYLIYSIVKEKYSEILKKRKKFSEFLPWAQEIISFIEQLELENIPDYSLTRIEKSAAIGYDVPESINRLLQNIAAIRNIYYKKLEENNLFSRGKMYLYAAKCIENTELNDFDKIIFCNFFYLHKTEIAIMREIYRQDKGFFIFQGDVNRWTTLKENAKHLKVSIPPQKTSAYEPQISILSGSDLHSQIGMVKEIIKDLPDLDKTVIVLPQPESVIPLISAIYPLIKNFNISLGYPIKRTSIFELLNTCLKSQETKKEGKYYTCSYLQILRNPLVKNLKLSSRREITRIAVHKLEEILKGTIPSKLGGSLFVRLSDIETLEELYASIRDTLRNIGIKATRKELKSTLKQLHRLFFYSFEKTDSFKSLCAVINEITTTLMEKSVIGDFPFNRLAIEKIFTLNEEFSASLLKEQRFSPTETLSIFLKNLEGEVISFKGSPLKGLQILGLMETRSLDFDNVIIISANESVLPKLKVYEPLIPREVMISLGINRLEKEEEIQRYQFFRLMHNSRKAFVIYDNRMDREKSRFVEEIIWEKQKKHKKLDILDITQATFTIKTSSYKTLSLKNKEITDFLRNSTFSASRLNTYLNCPLQFYYQYVLGLNKETEILDEPQAEEIGQFIHEFLEETLRCFVGKKITIDKDFENGFMRKFEHKFTQEMSKRMKADSFLLKRVVKNRLKRFLEEEKKENSCKEIVCLEKEYTDVINIKGIPLNFIAKVDRIDRYDNHITIIDYKTGSSNVIPKNINSLKNMSLSREDIKENIRSFQLPLYYIIISKYFPGYHINAQLYSLRTLKKDSLFPDDCPDISEYLDIYLKALEYIISEILNPDIPFVPDREERKCHHCPFLYICR